MLVTLFLPLHSDFTGEAGPPPSRARLVAAAVLAIGLLAAIGIVLFTAGGSGGDEGETAVPECVTAWNQDRAALRLGRHQSLAHRYTRVEVTRLAADGGPLAKGKKGDCAVIFAAQSLDPEPIAAAQIHSDGRWVAVSSQPAGTPARLGELQSGAVAGANATLGEDGALTPD